jgi:hypothetical protein
MEVFMNKKLALVAAVATVAISGLAIAQTS